MQVSFSHTLSSHCRNKKVVCIDMKIFDTRSLDPISIYLNLIEIEIRILDRNPNRSFFLCSGIERY